MQLAGASTTPSLAASPLLDHLHTMMGPHGMYQHATGTVPLLREGYCTDDNARAVQTLIYLMPHIKTEDRAQVETYLQSCWQFLCDAEETPGTYYNFRSADGEWLTFGRSGDMYARLIRAIVSVLERDWDTTRQAAAARMLPALVRQALRSDALRAWAEYLIALAPHTPKTPDATQLVAHSLQQLLAIWHDHATDQWRWFEPQLTYANALMPHGLLNALSATSTTEHHTTLEQSTDFLIRSTMRNGCFIPIGSNGWYEKGGTPSEDNQQPIEAGTMFDFLLDYHQTYKLLPVETVAAPYLWFYGLNTHHCVMVNPAAGTCYDGLFTSGPNTNSGAESLLAYLWSETRLLTAPPKIQAYIEAQRAALAAES